MTKSKNLLSLAVFGLVLLLSISACKEEVVVVGGEFRISGVVFDLLTGEPLSGVSVATTGDVANTATTGDNGTYSIVGSPTGMISFTLGDYSTMEMEINSANLIDVELESTDDRKDAVFAAYFDEAGNTNGDPAFAAGSIKPTGSLGSPVSFSDGFCEVVSYKGAVDPNGTEWYDEWSFYDNLINGTTTSDALSLGSLETWDDADMQAAGNNVIWTNDKTYILDGFVFVNDGQTLNIQAGTIIQGKPGEGANASALIVARGGKIMAEGTAAQPIIFTYEGDNGGSAATLRGQWGGLIILGNASLNSNPGETNIEGIPTTEARGLYGGNDDNDNSGVLSYVSIRHGGTNIGSDNEINGLTLGGVGAGTTIDYVEVVANKDDGIEWFGGTARAKHLIVAFCADDALDYDEGYRGKNQFVIVHQDPTADAADRGGEHDGGTDPEDGTPFATPTFCNVTSIGNSGERTITFRDNAGGFYVNSIFSGFGRGIDIENLVGTKQDSYKQWVDGNLGLMGNVFHNIDAGTTGADLFKVTHN
ncbi:MAG: carboxypeptidase regulatory-like domain-containing protein [Bacteroidota bacterium]